MKLKNLTGISIASAMTIFGSSAFAECGDITMADMNWPSATLMANVDKIILEAGYGCSVEMVVGATTTTFASMNEKANPMLLVSFGLMLSASHWKLLWEKAACTQL